MNRRFVQSNLIHLSVAAFPIFFSSCTEEKTYITNNPLIDQRPPSVEWTSINGRTDFQSVVSGSVEIAFQARDESGIDSVRLYIDGLLRMSLTPDSSQAGRLTYAAAYSWNTLSDSDGVHNLAVRAFDKAGNSGETPVLLLTVRNTSPDHTPPTIEWLAPSGGATVSDTISLTLQTIDSSGVDSVRLFLNGTYFRTHLTTAPSHANEVISFLWNTLSDSDGVYVLEARAWDKAGNQGFCPALVVRVQNAPTPPLEDRTPPRVEWLLPHGGETVEGEITLSIKVADNKGVSFVWLHKNGFAPVEWRFAGRDDSLYSIQWDTRHDPDGAVNLEVLAWDSTGNVGTAPALLVHIANTTQHEADRTPPRIRWISPAPGSTVRDTLQLEFEVTDETGVDSVQIFLDGEVVRVLAPEASVHYIVHMCSNNWTNGRRIVEVRAYDSAGNIGIGNPIGLTVDNHRVIWVPDDFEKIQDAINASIDGDTVRVRAGTYNESIQMFDKMVSLVSEAGPEATIIDMTETALPFYLTGGQDNRVIIRGFTFQSYYDVETSCIVINGSNPTFCNNIIKGSPPVWGFDTGSHGATIQNNLVFGLAYGVVMGLSWGNFTNNMVISCTRYGFWSSPFYGQPLDCNYNLFFENADYKRMIEMPNWGADNLVDVDPRFVPGTYRLDEFSPAKDAGDPTLRDLDGSRSDIGVYGGPYAYPPPNR